jgi:hypothetical protein
MINENQPEINLDIEDLASEAAAIPELKTVKERFREEMQFSIIRSVWDCILNDKWMFAATWAAPRMGKTTCCLRIAYAVYRDWDLVLNSVVFNLSGLLYKMDHRQPMLIWDKAHFHHRIPLLIFDDMGSGSNKAATRHEVCWDTLKGAWDSYGTRVAVVLATMNQPDEITRQLSQKITHELWIPTRGVAKFDECFWSQNYYGWQAKTDKEWKQSFEFDRVPADIYRQYDEMRQSLVDEINQKIKDEMASSDITKVLKRMVPDDWNLLNLIQQKGLLTEYEVSKADNSAVLRETIKRCRGRNLVISMRDGSGHYKTDISDFGLEVLKNRPKETEFNDSS